MVPPWTLDSLMAPWLETGDSRPAGPPTLDSRDVDRGSLFLAARGLRTHGLSYLDAALQAGATAVVWETDGAFHETDVERRCSAQGAASVPLPRLAEQASAIAARYYGDPAADMATVGVTGTDGKTSVSQFVAHALDGWRGRCGVIGTLGWGWPSELAVSAYTTPDAVTVQQWLATMRDRGAGAVAMEVSSHALDQGRVAAVSYDVAVFTNLSRDHLDYHGSEAAYAAAKRRLFELGTPRPVLNLDDAHGRRLADVLRDRDPVTYGIDPRGDARVRCLQLDPEPGGMRLALDIDGRSATLRLPLIGRFNAANAMATLGTMLALGLPEEEIVSRLSRLQPVAGRMECFRTPGRPAVIIDYAHTPAALQAALAATRSHFPGEVWAVFGCGGDRDRGKRPMMGAIARAGAEHIVLTSDNPRAEDPDRIVTEIQEGMGSDALVEVIPDRRAAIHHAIRRARTGDVIVLAGKGHEDYQIVGDERRPFSDRACVTALLKEVV